MTDQTWTPTPDGTPLLWPAYVTALRILATGDPLGR